MSLALEGGFVTHEINKVSWFVKFPSHWNLVPAKRLFPESKERAQESDEQLSATQEYGVIPQSEFMRLAGRRVVQLLSNIELRKRVEVDDFVISMRSFQGGLERAWACGGIRSSYVVLRPVESVYVGYYQFLFKSDVYIQALQSTANFIRDGQDMNYQNFVLIDLPYPPYEEQRQIAAFLQHEITKIDSLIAEQEKLIALLKEKRQAVISHAVTKGLNPDIPMKDSGVEWLGQVPEHWERKSLNYLIAHTVDNRGRTPPLIDEGIPMCEVSQVAGNGLYTSDDFSKFISIESYKQYVRSDVKEDDILFVTVGATFGKACLVPPEPDYFIAQNVVGFRCSNDVDPKYLMFLLSSDVFKEAISATNKSSTIDNIKVSDLIKTKLAVPLFPEQKEIANYILAIVDKYEALVKQANLVINLLQERRSALISAAVTGKIDVRGWQPPAAE